MCSSCEIISSIHSAEHTCRNSTSVCSIHDFPYNKLNKKTLLHAAAIIRERLMCRHAVAKVRLLFESSFYSRAAFVQDFMVYFNQSISIPIFPRIWALTFAVFPVCHPIQLCWVNVFVCLSSTNMTMLCGSVACSLLVGMSAWLSP